MSYTARFNKSGVVGEPRGNIPPSLRDVDGGSFTHKLRTLVGEMIAGNKDVSLQQIREAISSKYPQLDQESRTWRHLVFKMFRKTGAPGLTIGEGATPFTASADTQPPDTFTTTTQL